MSVDGTVDRALVDEVGEKIADLRAHLGHAHPLPPAWVGQLEPAELAALHRRLHGRAVDPDPSLVDAHLVEIRTDPERRAITALPLDDALDHDRALVWLPLRIADRVHGPDAPGHTDKGGCRACADVIEAVVRSMVELDRAPQARIAALEAEVAARAADAVAIAAALDEARTRLMELIAAQAETGTDAPELLAAIAAIDAALDRVPDATGGDSAERQ